MKVYRVVTDRDGDTTKTNGKTATEIVREEFRYAAEDMSLVWQEISWLRNDPERTLIAIVEEAPQIKVLNK